MFDTPIYKFNQPLGVDAQGNRHYREIAINVTKSAPSFDAPGKTLAGALDRVIGEIGLRKNDNILDFGGGKLRNTLHLLKIGYNVCTVEYQDLFVDSSQAADARKRADKYKRRFRRLIYPHEFESSTETYDLALLVNVINIMPVPAERLLVLHLCHKVLKPNGFLFWYTQRGDADYKSRLAPENELGDGHFTGTRRRYKTFYREFRVEEIDKILHSTGYTLEKSIPAGSRNQARLYRRAETSAMEGVLTIESIKAAGVVDEKIPIPTKPTPRVISSKVEKRKGRPDPDQLKVPSLFAKKLKRIPLGHPGATEYQHHVFEILSFIFSSELKNMKLEEPIFGRIKRIDILASNKSRRGFFFSLKADHNIYCPNIVIECKNYKHTIANPEFDQLGGRLGKKLGMFGILAYRQAQHPKKVLERCRSYFDNEEKHLLPLNDNDFRILLEMKNKEDTEGIESYLDDILLEVKAG